MKEIQRLILPLAAVAGLRLPTKLKRRDILPQSILSALSAFASCSVPNSRTASHGKLRERR
jgi:hypothetical protein